MDTIGKRLRWARVKAGFDTAAEFARFIEVLPPTYYGYENDNRTKSGINPGFLIRVAKALKVDPGWLITGAGKPRPDLALSPAAKPVKYAPVISWVQAGHFGSADMNATAADEYIAVTTASNNIAAVEVVGTSMNRVAGPRSFIVVDYDQRHPEDGWYVVARVDDEMTFKLFRSTNGPIRLEPDSTEPHDTLYPAEGFEIIGRVIEVIRRL
jgi:SOS-response transcriptional repressor LexA